MPFHAGQQQKLITERPYSPAEAFSRSIITHAPWDSIVDFATHPSFCGMTLYPRQQTLLRLIFMETEQMTQYDRDVIEEWRKGFMQRRDVFGVQPDIWERIDYLKERGYRRFPEVQAVLGRRASKGMIGGILGAEQMAYMFSLDDWQAHYGVVPGKDGYLTVVATSQSQAKRHQFRDIAMTIEGCAYLQPHIASSRDCELAIRTPADMRQLAALKAAGMAPDHEVATLHAIAMASNSDVVRGAASFGLFLDEFAFMVQGTGSSKSGEEVYESATPSLDQFDPDALVYIPSSPFCLAPETPVLTEDLCWVPVGSLCVGDKLIGFDEESPSQHGVGRRWRQAEVTETSVIQAPRYELTMRSGKRIVGTGEHLWLTRRVDGMGRGRPRNGTQKRSQSYPQNWCWIKMQDLMPGDRIKSIGVDRWDADENSREAGYLAGFFDGEGHLSGLPGGANSSDTRLRGINLGYSQNYGPVQEYVERLLKDRGFAVNTYKDRDGRMARVHIGGGAMQVMRFLGSIRPERLLPKFLKMLYGSRIYGPASPAVDVVESVRYLDEGPVIALGTSTHTLIADGLFSHNTKTGQFFTLYKQGSVLMRSYTEKNGVEYRRETEDSLGVDAAAAITEMTADPLKLVFQGPSWAQPVTTPVLTPQGWRPMGDLVAGDFVIGSDGHPTKITGVRRRGVEPAYLVTMNDGSATRTSAEHLWSIQDWNERAGNMKPRGTIASTAQVATLLPGDPKHARTFIPMVGSPPVFDTLDEELPIPGYLLGYLLGDGCFRAGNSPRVALTEPEQNTLLEQELTHFPGMKLVYHSGVDWGIVSGYQTPSRCSLCSEPPTARGLCPQHYSQAKYRKELERHPRAWVNLLGQRLFDLGLGGVLGPDKFVPASYLVASPDQRLAVLQGLMDADGSYAAGKHSAIFFNVSRQLCEAVVELTESLGGQARMYPRPPRGGRMHNGKIINGKLPSWHVSVRLPGQLNPFRLPRKAEAYQAGIKENRRAVPVRKIVSVAPAGDEEMQCIEVDAPDGLYVTEHYIVTHNCLYQDWERGEELVGRSFKRPIQPDLTSESQRRRMQRNPEKFRVERLGQFAEVQAQYLDPEKVEQMFAPLDWRPPLEAQTQGRFDRKYRIHCDPGRTNANFAMAIAHLEDAPCTGCGWRTGDGGTGWANTAHICPNGGQVWPHVIFDLLHVWRPQDFPADVETGRRTVDYIQVDAGLRDILRRFRSTEKVSFDQWNCIAAGTLISTDQGLQTIRDFAGCMDVGEVRQSTDLICSRGSTEMVRQVYRRGETDTLRFTALSGIQLECTPEHRLWVRRQSGDSPQDRIARRVCLHCGSGLPSRRPDRKYCGSTCGDQYRRYGQSFNPPGWLRAGEIRTGDELFLQRGYLFPDNPVPMAAVAPRTSARPILKDEVDEDVAAFLGYIASEGCYRNGTFRFCQKDTDVVSDFCDVAEAILGRTPTRTHRTHTSKSGEVTENTECRIRSTPLAQALDFDQPRSEHISTPSVILRSPRKVVTAYLSALFEGDGGVTPDGISYWSASETLTRETQQLLLGLGIYSRIRRYAPSRSLGIHDRWVLTASGPEAIRFCEEIGFRSPRKQQQAFRYMERLRAGRTLGAKRARFLEGDEVRDPVIQIEPSRAECYDLSVPATECYIANGVISHNSASFISNLRQEFSPAIRVTEVTFTEKVNQERCEKFKAALNLGWVSAYRDNFYDANFSLLEQELKFLSEKNGKVVKQDFGPVTTKDLADCAMQVTVDLLHDALDRWSANTLTASAYGSSDIPGLKSGREFDRIGGNPRRTGRAWQDLERQRNDRLRGRRYSPSRTSSIRTRDGR